jgi:hypothetical protein
MARTGKRANTLKAVLAAAGLGPTADKLPRPAGAEHHDELLALYRQLGGRIDVPTWRPGGWDLTFDGRLLVELDEQLHFNRYRALTLQSSWSTDLPWTAAYRTYCTVHEARCLKDGCSQQRWTNPSCARNFSGGPAGDLDAGAPRWKQRAFYDAMKDTLPTSGLALTFARVSIYDTVNGELLDDVLEERAHVDPNAVLALVRARTISPADQSG